MARLIVMSKAYKATLDSREYIWSLGLKWLKIEKIDGSQRMLIPREAIEYIIEEADLREHGKVKKDAQGKED